MMASKVVAMVIFFSAVNWKTASLLELPRVLNGNPTNEIKPPPFNPCKSRFGPLCFDCKTQLTCANDMLNFQLCSSIDPSKPYCRGSACTSQAIDNCLVTTFRCTSIGPFPDPTDCTKYYFCPDLSDQGAITMQCPDKYAYDSSTGFCKQMRSSSDCKTISCAGQSNRYQVWSFDKSILVYCIDTPDLRETVLFRCKDKNLEYDPETWQCKFVCKTEGRFVDSLDCRKYYECSKNGSSLAVRHESCPGLFKFDKETKMCVFSVQC